MTTATMTRLRRVLCAAAATLLMLTGRSAGAQVSVVDRGLTPDGTPKAKALTTERLAVQKEPFVVPVYPDSLYRIGLSGEVVVQFVVDTMGRAMLETFAVVKSTHPLFTTAVRKAVREMRFEPAVVDGKKVPQKVQSPFTFEQERITR